MGDRANILVKEEGEQVCFYSHWTGSDLPKILQDALKRGRDRWTDFQYLTRIIFSDMIKGSEKETTGFGITQEVHDGENRVIIVDVEKQTVKIKGEVVSFEIFIGYTDIHNIEF